MRGMTESAHEGDHGMMQGGELLGLHAPRALVGSDHVTRNEATLSPGQADIRE